MQCFLGSVVADEDELRDDLVERRQYAAA